MSVDTPAGLRGRRTLALLCAAVLAAAPAAGQAPAQSSQQQGWRSLFFDEEDGQLDASNLLARGGFIPMPIIITEPAVDGGFGLVAYFVQNRGRTPVRTILGGARTGNGSWGGGAFRSGAFGDGRFLYKVGAGTGLSVMDFYPGNRDVAVTFNNDIDFVGGSVRYRFGDSGFSAGPILRYRNNEIAIDAGDRFPQLEELEGREITLPSVGFGVHFDNRNNPMTPTKGLNVIAEGQLFDEAIGSDADFTTTSVFGAWFGTWDRWTLGAMAEGKSASSDAPFFMKPDVQIRALARNRYRGDETLSLEAEVSRQIAKRWKLLGFAGYGRTFGDDDADVDAGSWGVGFRYRIASKLGLDVGLDYAFGPDDEVFYIQFGHAWGSGMD